MADFAQYQQDGISFFYPIGWTLQEESLGDAARAIIVSDIQENFWMLGIYPSETSADSATVEILEMMGGEYEKIESSPISKVIGEHRLDGYEMNFFYLDLTNTAIVLGVATNEKTYIVYWQSADRMALTDEVFLNTDVFEAITYTFLEHLYRSQSSS